MRKVKVSLGIRSYYIYVGADILNNLAEKTG
jgi:hypothetical protein